MNVGQHRSRLVLVLSAAALTLAMIPAGGANASVQPAASSPGHSPVPVFSSAYGMSCPHVTYCVAVGAYNANDVVGTLTELWNGSAWSVIPSPNKPGATSSVLNAVSCTSASYCAAVGSYTAGSEMGWGLAELWNGSSWTVVDTPTPEGGTFVGLSGISCASESFCVAVGSYTNSRSRPVTLIEQWNGSSWSIVHSPNPAGAKNSGLSAVSCASTSACMTTGYDTGADFVRVTLVESWNGSRWSLVDSPNPDGAQGSVLNGVSCPSAARCRAVGSYFTSDFVQATLAESWDGSRWSVADSPSPPGSFSSNLFGISCASASRCLTVGDSYSPSFAARDDTLVESWDGSSWSIVASPSPSTTSVLDAVSCASADSCLAGGTFFNNSGNYQTLAESWNGRVVSIVSQEAVLAGVSCVSATYCVAVGSYIARGSVDVTLAEEWNGTSWRLVPTPNPSNSTGSYLTAITCLSPDRCVAVGYYFKPDNSRATLVESWNGVSWSIVHSPNPHGAAYSVLYGIFCTSAANCSAVGSAAGRALAERWDGSEWTIVPSAIPPSTAYAELAGIYCASASHCLAVGYESDTHYHADLTFAEQWDGSAWSVVPSAAPGKNFFHASLLHGISCSAVECLAVGEREQASGKFTTFTERWTGKRWVVQDSPSPSGSIYSELSAISCVDTRCLAVGDYFDHSGDFVPLSELWTGTTWRIVRDENPPPLPSEITYLLGVSCTAPRTCLATGTYGNPANLNPLTQRWNGSGWHLSRAS